MSDDDNGELAIGIKSDPDRGIIQIEFGTPTRWIAGPPQVMRDFAKLIFDHAVDLDGDRSARLIDPKELARALGAKFPYGADPDRAHLPELGIYIRAQRGGRFEPMDHNHLKWQSLLVWMMSKGAQPRDLFLVDLVFAILGHRQIAGSVVQIREPKVEEGEEVRIGLVLKPEGGAE
jgi:hypothetical protein